MSAAGLRGQLEANLAIALYEKEAVTSPQGPACISKSSTLPTLLGFTLTTLTVCFVAGVLAKSEGECWIS